MANDTTPRIFPLDTTGVALSNLVENEIHALTSTTEDRQYFIVPTCAPFFDESIRVIFKTLDGQVKVLQEGIDYHTCFEFISATLACAKKISGGILFIDTALNGVVILEKYQTVGGDWVLQLPITMEEITSTIVNPRVVSWEQVTNLPEIFPPSAHNDDINDIADMDQLLVKIQALTDAITQDQPTQAPVQLQLFQTKYQVGLGNVDNFKTANDQQAIDGVSNTLFMTPLGVAKKLQAELVNFLGVFMPMFKAANCPTTGSFNAGNYVSNTNPKRLTWTSASLTGKFNGCIYVVKGWVRMTTGNAHVLGVDWEEDRIIVKD